MKSSALVMVSAFLLLAPAARANTAAPTAAKGASPFDQFRTAVDRLESTGVALAMSSEMDREPEIDGRLADLKDVATKLANRPPAAGGAGHKDVDRLVVAYFKAIEGIGWLDRAESLRQDVFKAQQALDSIVAAYGGYDGFKLPAGVRVTRKAPHSRSGRGPDGRANPAHRADSPGSREARGLTPRATQGSGSFGVRPTSRSPRLRQPRPCRRRR